MEREDSMTERHEATIEIEDGTEGRGYGEDVRLDLTGHVDIDLASAVDIEHPCTDPDCDIREANEEGFARTAAELLYGATETPVLDAVLAHYGIGPTDICPFDSDEWTAWVEHYREWSKGEESR
jgi:hypothetical protein